MSKTQTSNSSVSIPKEWQDRFNSIYGMASSAADKPFEKWGTESSDFVAPINDQQEAGISGVNTAASSYKPLMTAATSATTGAMGNVAPSELEIQKYMSPYIENVADTTAAQLRQAHEQAQSGALGTAISSGAFGGDRAGVAGANLANQQDMALGSVMSQLYDQGFGKAVGIAEGQQQMDYAARAADLARHMQGAQQLAGLAGQTQQLGLQGAEAQIQAGTLQQQNEQAGKDALIQQFMQEKGYPFQVAQFLANVGGSLGSLYGSTTTQTSPRSWWGKDGGAVPEYASGGGVSGPYMTAPGSMPESITSYIPEAYLPVGQLLVSDPSSMEQAKATLAQRAEQAAGFGDSLSSLKDNFGNGAESSVFDVMGRLGLGRALGGSVGDEKDMSIHHNPPAGYMQSVMESQVPEKSTDGPKQGGVAGNSSSGGGLGSLLSGVGTAATGISTLLPLLGLSDPRAKRDAIRIGHTDNGMPIHSFKYKDDPSGQTHVGFMADEVAQQHPDAVHRRNDGYLGVDYSKSHKFAAGGLAGPEETRQVESSQRPITRREMESRPSWEDVRRGIIKREGGFDDRGAPNYNALFNGAERSQEFATVPVSEMALSDAKYLSRKGGEYGNWVKGHNKGEFSTPMGAYQIVGDTLRDAQSALGIGDEDSMSPENQDRIAKWVYDTRVATAPDYDAAMKRQWSGYRAPIPSGPHFANGGIAGYMSPVMQTLGSDTSARHSPSGENQKGPNGMTGLLGAFGGLENLGGLASVLGMKGGKASGGRALGDRYAYADGGGPGFEEFGRNNPSSLGDALISSAIQNELPNKSAEEERRRLDALATISAGVGGQAQGPRSQMVGEYASLGTPAVSQNPRLVGESTTPTAPPPRMVGEDATLRSLAPSSSPIPQRRPEGLGSMESSPIPQRRPEGLGAPAPVSAPAPAASAPSSKGNAPATGRITGDYIVDGLVSRGMPEHVAKGYAINGWDESGFNPAAVGDNGAAIGIWQFNGPRGRQLKQFAESQGKSWQDPEVQMDYVVWENSNGEKGSYDRILNTENPQEAAQAVVNYWERPAEKNRRNRSSAYASWDGESYPGTGGFGSGVTASAAPSVGGGVSGGDVSVSSSGAPLGVGDTYQAGPGVKPYEDRTTIGKVVHNPDGSLNKDFLLSLLSGVGTMASSPSVSFGTSVLQGIGGAANTYAGQEVRREGITSSEIENRKMALEQYNQLMAQGLIPAGTTFDQYLGSVSKSNTPYSGAVSGSPTGGAAGERLDFSGSTQRFGDGTTVLNANDPQFLRQFISKYEGLSPDSYIGRQVTKAKENLANINAQGTTMGTDANGNPIAIPIAEAQEATNIQVEQAANAEATTAFKAAAAETLPTIEPQLNNIDRQADIFTKVTAGSGTEEIAGYTAILESFGIPLPEDWNDPSQVQSALKEAAQATISQFPGMANSGVATQIEQINMMAGDPNLRPEAIKRILALRKAGLIRQRDLYTMRGTWHQGQPDRNNQLAYQAWFDKEHPFEQYYKDSLDSMPKFSGEADTPKPDAATPAPAPATKLPPKKDLVKGGKYDVPGHGMMTWNGTEFE